MSSKKRRELGPIRPAAPPTGLEGGGPNAGDDQRRQATRVGMLQTGLPGLDRVGVHADPVGELTLGQAGPTTKTEHKAAEALAGSDCAMVRFSALHPPTAIQ